MTHQLVCVASLLLFMLAILPGSFCWQEIHSWNGFEETVEVEGCDVENLDPVVDHIYFDHFRQICVNKGQNNGKIRYRVTFVAKNDSVKLLNDEYYKYDRDNNNDNNWHHKWTRDLGDICNQIHEIVSIEPPCPIKLGTRYRITKTLDFNSTVVNKTINFGEYIHNGNATFWPDILIRYDILPDDKDVDKWNKNLIETLNKSSKIFNNWNENLQVYYRENLNNKNIKMQNPMVESIEKELMQLGVKIEKTWLTLEEKDIMDILDFVHFAKNSIKILNYDSESAETVGKSLNQIGWHKYDFVEHEIIDEKWFHDQMKVILKHLEKRTEAIHGHLMDLGYLSEDQEKDLEHIHSMIGKIEQFKKDINRSRTTNEQKMDLLNNVRRVKIELFNLEKKYDYE